jgi:hypothetical protein
MNIRSRSECELIEYHLSLSIILISNEEKQHLGHIKLLELPKLSLSESRRSKP